MPVAKISTMLSRRKTPASMGFLKHEYFPCKKTSLDIIGVSPPGEDAAILSACISILVLILLSHTRCMIELASASRKASNGARSYFSRNPPSIRSTIYSSSKICNASKYCFKTEMPAKVRLFFISLMFEPKTMISNPGKSLTSANSEAALL